MAYTRKQAVKKTNESMTQTWNTISGIMRVYGNTFKTKRGSIVKWSATISGKTKDNDEWVNYYVPVKFRGDDAKEPETDGLHTVEIGNAFMSVETYVNKAGEDVVVPVIVITANDIVE